MAHSRCIILLIFDLPHVPSCVGTRCGVMRLCTRTHNAQSRLYVCLLTDSCIMNYLESMHYRGDALRYQTNRIQYYLWDAGDGSTSCAYPPL